MNGILTVNRKHRQFLVSFKRGEPDWPSGLLSVCGPNCRGRGGGGGAGESISTGSRMTNSILGRSWFPNQCGLLRRVHGIGILPALQSVARTAPAEIPFCAAPRTAATARREPPSASRSRRPSAATPSSDGRHGRGQKRLGHLQSALGLIDAGPAGPHDVVTTGESDTQTAPVE